MQTSLIVLHTPMPIRSRLMGLLTVCIGMGPLGILLIGTIADFVGPMLAVEVVAASGFVVVCAIGVVWRRREGERSGRGGGGSKLYACWSASSGGKREE